MELSAGLFLAWVSFVLGDDSALSQLRQSVFFGYDKNVIPLEVCTASSILFEIEVLCTCIYFQHMIFDKGRVIARE